MTYRVTAVSSVRRSGPMISSVAATGFVEAIEAAGRDPDEVLRTVGLDRARVTDRQAFIPSAAFTLALDEAARVTGDDCFGLHLGEGYHPKDFGALAYVVLNSPTIAVAFDNVARYLHLYNEAATVSFDRTERHGVLHHGLSGVPAARRRQHQEYAFCVAVATIRMMAGSEWRPLEVRFEHAAPPHTDEHRRIFGSPVIFGADRNAIVVEREFCDRHVPAADRRLYLILEDYVQRVWERSPIEDSFVDVVAAAIETAVPNGELQLTETARTVGVSGRTLQRRLNEAGIEYKTLVGAIRRRLALRYLRDPKYTLSEVAYLLGYSEISAFSRAFKRWTGSPPSEHRRKG